MASGVLKQSAAAKRTDGSDCAARELSNEAQLKWMQLEAELNDLIAAGCAADSDEENAAIIAAADYAIKSSRLSLAVSSGLQRTVSTTTDSDEEDAALLVAANMMKK